MTRHSIESDSSASNFGEFEFDLHSPLLPLSTKDYHEWDTTEQDGSERQYPAQSRKRTPPNVSTLRRHHKLASLFRVATYFVVSCWVLAATSVCGWAGWFFYTRHAAYAKSIFAFPLEPNPLPVEHLVPPFAASPSPLPLSAVQRHLDGRFETLSLAPSTLPCDGFSSAPLDGNSTLALRYSSLPHSGPYLLALNLYNSQQVLPTLSKAILSVSDFLGRSNVHVSVFENGSRDNTTLALAHLAAALSTLGVAHTIVSDPRPTDWKKVDRIDQLAVYRNVALAPVSRGLEGRAFEDVLFMNDVYVGPMDALELLWQRREQAADAACAMDWRETKGVLSKVGKSSVKMYDSWVARTMNGNMLRSRLDIFSEARDGVEELFGQDDDRPSRERFERGLPVPVYSCWNGMIALTAEPFRTTGVNPRVHDRVGPSLQAGQNPFRPVKQAPKFRSALRSQGECAASECKTLAKDFWARGYNRWLMVPTVRATYSTSTYTHPHLLSVLSRAKSFLLDPSSASDRAKSSLNPKIDWSSWSAPKSIVCWDWVRGFHVDLEWLRMTRNKPW
ncbi:hypothetical protein JCM11491_006250 [Sporobolomyces phaffii]